MSKENITSSEQTKAELRGRRDIPIFYHPDWLDIVCGEGQYFYLDVRNGGGALMAFMPVCLKNKYGIRAMTMPRLTPYGGVFFMPEVTEGKRTTVYTKVKKTVEDLLDQLQNYAFIGVSSFPDFPDAQVFNWKGFKSSVRYTYLIDGNTDVDTYESALDSKMRNSISTAHPVIELVHSNDVDLFFEINQETFNRKQVEMIYDIGLVREIFERFQNHDFYKAEISLAYENSQPTAGILVMKDTYSTYYLLSGRKKEANRGAVGVLLDTAIRKSLNEGLNFDFEGSNLKGVEPFFRAFGGKLTPVYHFNRTSNLFMRLLFTALGKV
ncbi:MAG: hypothetical protein KDC49_23165 [Saprospiraceae bacterium]|nr:hypothetical protein [Saprospiraceae bacterium]